MPRTRERHYARFDTSVCPTGPDGCEHTTYVENESCECCGAWINRTVPNLNHDEGIETCGCPTQIVIDEGHQEGCTR